MPEGVVGAEGAPGLKVGEAEGLQVMMGDDLLADAANSTAERRLNGVEEFADDDRGRRFAGVARIFPLPGDQ